MMVAVCFTRCDVILLCYDTFASTELSGLGTWDWLAHFLYNTYLHLLPTDLCVSSPPHILAMYRSAVPASAPLPG